MSKPTYLILIPIVPQLVKKPKCVCCLTETGPFVNLTNCSHSKLLETMSKFYKVFSTLACYTCHNQLKHFTNFKQQVEISSLILNGQADRIPNQNRCSQLARSKPIIVTEIDPNNDQTTESEDGIFIQDTVIKIEPADLSYEPDTPDVQVFSIVKTEESIHKPEVEMVTVNTNLIQTPTKPAKDQHNLPGVASLSAKLKPPSDPLAPLKKDASKVDSGPSKINKIVFGECTVKLERLEVMKSKSIQTEMKDGGSQSIKIEIESDSESSSDTDDNHSLLRVKRECKLDGAPENSSQPSEKKSDETQSVEKPFACSICDYRGKRKPNLRLHMRTHASEKPFACTFCDYKCITNSKLKVHLLTHTGEKPCPCPHCDFKTVFPSKLQVHMRKHFSDKPYACTYCDFKTKLKSYLPIHMKRHTVEKAFACTICDHKCLYKSSLTEHMKKHKGTVEKRHACPYCQFKTLDKFYIKVHIRSHTGEKPFVCTICGYRNVAKSRVVLHMKKHTTATSNDNTVATSNDNTVTTSNENTATLSNDSTITTSSDNTATTSNDSTAKTSNDSMTTTSNDNTTITSNDSAKPSSSYNTNTTSNDNTTTTLQLLYNTTTT